MHRKSTDLGNLALHIEQAQQAAERRRIAEEMTIRALMKYREQEPRRVDQEIAERREQAERRLAADERRIAELIHLREIADSDKATMLEQWAESLEIDPDVKSLSIHLGDELDLPAYVRQAWTEAIPFSVVDIAPVARLTLQITRLRAQRRALLESAVVGLCGHPDCDMEARYDCAFCDERYCEAHGWPDMPVMEGEEETTSMCWRCQAKTTNDA
jgi:hypothetical protein